MSQYKCSKCVSILVFFLFATKPVKHSNRNCAHTPRTKREVVCQDLSAKGLNEIPSNIKQDTTNINLAGNDIKSVKTVAFKGLGNLLQIDLRDNYISEIQEGAFEGISSKIESIRLLNNKLKKLEAKIWRGLKEIMYLDIMNNELTTISHDCFGPDLSLTSLVLAGNKIIHIDPNTFKSMPNGLDYLSLHGNKLEWIPCFQNIQDGHTVAGKADKNKRVLTLDISANPFRCQPCYCWAPVDEPFHCGLPWDLLSVESKKTLGHDCRSLSSMLESRHMHMQCCKAIETEPNGTCLSNPEGFADPENVLYTKQKSKEKCTILGKENVQQTTIDLNLVSGKESNNGMTNTMNTRSQNVIIAVVLLTTRNIFGCGSIL